MFDNSSINSNSKKDQGIFEIENISTLDNDNTSFTFKNTKYYDQYDADDYNYAEVDDSKTHQIRHPSNVGIFEEVSINSSSTTDDKENYNKSNFYSYNDKKSKSSTKKKKVFKQSQKKLANDGVDENNVLGSYTEEQVMEMGRNFALKYNLPNENDIFGRAAALARSPNNFDRMEFLTQGEKIACYDEIHHKWKNIPKKLIAAIIGSAMSASVQGFDESIINGANLFYPKAVGLGSGSDHDNWIEGLINGAPYLCCAGISCWLTDWLNNKLGRKKVIFITCAISAITCFLQGFSPTNSWVYLFVVRFFLGFGIGPKSATTSVYLAECSTKRLRGVISMNWQTFTAFGIMWGYAFSLIFYKVGDNGVNGGLNWRLMLGSAMLPAIFVMIQIPWCPESPRWLLGKGRYLEAYESTVQLRSHKILACRDLFYQHVLIMEESSLEIPYFIRLKEVFTVRRNRNAFVTAFICAFMQQFCSINIQAYYSSSIFLKSGFDGVQALTASLGFGIINFVFAIPAFFMIDRFGRRFLLLNTFPWLALFVFVTGFAFWIPDQETRVGIVSMGIYVFTAIYSFGMGVVPFVIAGEVFPLYIRAIGASLFTVVLWGFNFILAITWPSMLKHLYPQGSFGFYAGWNIIGWCLVYFFMPETKMLTLEELDEIFDVPLWVRAKFQFKELWPNFQEYILRRHVKRQEPLDKHTRMALMYTGWEDKPNIENTEIY
ncbi:related to arabinose-proton symporter [Saccharomycodes ludwigii]|uniref:Related to arabinose-proton symporter n=1 Tax=Saccharomycodes ludwigii TaxID=36035 RepID=A0A376B227_9ASCO|nr:hypothetical protein SCDLUD_000137 [Saccharomycodes ludwigii]KAH3902557.1 hypothetical protein SCDLUD_000137 [Saccharomycodes ludwigii]SSD58738.1 related to arabinose-proton symporter [Saccharomycodes ludwigii]